MSTEAPNNGSKRPRTSPPATHDDRSHSRQRVRLNDQLFQVLGLRYFKSAEELLEHLIAAGLGALVQTFDIKVEKLGASHGNDHISVELDTGLPGQMAEVKREIEKKEGVKPWEAQLYRSEEKWDGGYGSPAQQEAALLSNDHVFDGPCTLQLVSQDFEAGSESNITWTHKRGTGFKVEGSVLSNNGVDFGAAVSAETISHSDNTVQGVSWTVADPPPTDPRTTVIGYFIGLTSQAEVRRLDDVDFAFGVDSGGYLSIHEQGLVKLAETESDMFPDGSTECWKWRKSQAGDVLVVNVQGNQVLYTKNGKTIARSLVPPGFPLRAAAFFGYAYGDEAPQVHQRAVDVQLQLADQA